MKSEEEDEDDVENEDIEMKMLMMLKDEWNAGRSWRVQANRVHNTAMSLSSRALKDGLSIEMANFYINSATKLMRTYTTQMEALIKYRNKGKQQITVKHQHVNVNEGGQAVIGDVNQGGGNG